MVSILVPIRQKLTQYQATLGGSRKQRPLYDLPCESRIQEFWPLCIVWVKVLRMNQEKFKGCIPQILLGPLLKTLFHLDQTHQQISINFLILLR